MTEKVVSFQSGLGQIAPLANIGVIENALHRLGNRQPGDPGLFVICGHSGTGKSMAAAWAKARHRSYYLQLDDYVTRKGFLVDLHRVMGMDIPKGTAKDLLDSAATQLASSRRTLIIDEFDFIVDKEMVMAVFSLYEKTKASIILIGEERLPAKLANNPAWEKFDGRVLDTLYAEPVNLSDARTLAQYKYPQFSFADDLLQHLVDIAKRSVRRVNNNLGLIYNEGMSMGWDGCDLTTWGNRPLQEAGMKRRVE
jgi:hypothetical protein